MPKDLLLFLAVLPGEEIQEEVTAFKEYARDHFGSSHALKSPPHITLIPPFRWSPDRRRALVEIVSALARTRSPFYLTLCNFACFRPRVIFVDVEESAELSALQSALAIELAEKLDLKGDRGHGFHPHMTVAFKDLRRSVFQEAWAYFSQQSYQRTFTVNQISLLRHNGRRWEADRAFVLGTGGG